MFPPVRLLPPRSGGAHATAAPAHPAARGTRASLQLDCFAARWCAGSEILGTAADEIGAAHAPQRHAQQGPVVGIVIAQERLVQPAHLGAPGDATTFSEARVTLCNGFLPVWYIAVAIAMGVGRKVCTWSTRKPLCFSHSASFQHVLVGGARMRGDEIGESGTAPCPPASKTCRTTP